MSWQGKNTIEYQVKLQIVSLSLQIAVFGETPVSPFLQIGFNLFANLVSRFLQIQFQPFCKFNSLWIEKQRKKHGNHRAVFPRIGGHSM